MKITIFKIILNLKKQMKINH